MPATLRNTGLLVAVLLLNFMARAITASSISCDDVADVFAQNVGTSDSVPSLPVKGEPLSTCSAAIHATNGLSCCTENMERSFVSVSSDYVHKLMEASNTELTSIIKRNLDSLMEHIAVSMNRAFNATSDTLARLYQIPKEAHQPVLRRLFEQFKSFIDGGNIHLEDSITDFYTHLFPSVYHYVLSRQPMTSGRSETPGLEEFNQCLMDFHDEIQPFGTVPALFAKRVHFAFKRAQAMVKTMRVMLNAIRVVETVDIDAKCRHTFARLHFCSMCAGVAHAKPCRGFCLNVVRGCLPNIMDLSPFWDSLVDSFQNLQMSMLKKNNVLGAMAYFNGNVSEALMKAMTEVPRIYNEVSAICQGLASTFQADTDPLDHLADTPEPLKMLPSLPNGPVVSPHNDVIKFMKRLDNSKGFLSRLADGLCRRVDIFEQEMRSDTCWNGTSVGRYTRGVPEANIITQAQHNSEVTVSLYPKHRLLEVKDEMLLMKKNLSFLSNQEMMVGDQSYGSGDFYQPNHFSDDEDFMDLLSGSGSGFQPIGGDSETKGGPGGKGRTTLTSINIDIDKSGDDRWGDNKPGENDGGNGSQTVSSAPLMLVVCCGLLWRRAVAMATASSLS